MKNRIKRQVKGLGMAAFLLASLLCGELNGDVSVSGAAHPEAGQEETSEASKYGSVYSETVQEEMVEVIRDSGIQPEIVNEEISEEMQEEISEGTEYSGVYLAAEESAEIYEVRENEFQDFSGKDIASEENRPEDIGAGEANTRDNTPEDTVEADTGEDITDNTEAREPPGSTTDAGNSITDDTGNNLTDDTGNGITNTPGAAPENDSIQELAQRAEFTLALHTAGDIMKAGAEIFYEAELANTGDVPLYDLEVQSTFSCPKISPQWEAGENMEADGASARIFAMEPGERRTLYLSVKLLEEQSGTLGHQVTVRAANPLWEADALEEPEILEQEASVSGAVSELAADFSVTKTADRAIAMPGDTIIYQICIQNTGERTLHSVISSDRFVDADVSARFDEQEGVTLNGDRTKAMIEEILPGEGVALQAQVTLPETMVSGELLNEVTVVTKETGGRTVISRASVQVQAPPPTQEPESPVYENAPENRASLAQKASTAPKTADASPLLCLTALLLCSLTGAAGVSRAIGKSLRR